jgi:catechol 2,3-dioxygenase-like lactoylglutathione lyase family enzyme
VVFLPPYTMIGTGHHQGIVVSDLDRAVEFYRDVLGMEELFRLSTDPEPFGELLGVDHDAPAEIAFLDAGGGMKLELEAHDSGTTNVNDAADPTDVGYPHLCLEVDDIEAVYEELEEHVGFLSQPGSATESGATIVYFRDPDGNLIELIEFPDDGD